MPFDKPTRNLLAKTVAACRDRLADDVAGQLQSRYGLYPDGAALDVARTEDDRCAAEDLRALLAHFETSAAGGDSARRAAAYQRLVREIGFTTLNRLAALRLCEERGLLVECVRRGMASDGFQLYDRIAGGALGNRYQTYRAFLESLFDELALDLGVLFDRRAPQSLVFPSEAALADVLALLNVLNDPELAAHDVDIWRQDETIGWIYQYYNDPAERQAMRKASQAPRNSRELAVRNQFFTPRYVVEFLTDNTLGRTWYEMRQGDTSLVEKCRYLVRRPGEDAGTGRQGDKGASHRVTVSPRPQKDPRDLKILDPASGSGHFLLYSFDLLLVIYEEAWADPATPPFTETSTRLADDYTDLDGLHRAVPGLILRHNLHGIDIDPRAVQIAALALWLRTQRAYQDLGLDPAERPRITRTNLVTAEPMPGDRELLDEFLRDLRPRVLGDLVRVVFEKMGLAGEAGSLLKIEEELAGAIAEAHRLWASEPEAEQLALFAEDQRSKPEQLPLFDVSGITDAAFWETAEERVLGALRDYAARAENGQGTRRRLFAGDAARGFAFVDLCKCEFHVVLMNPPFGDASKSSRPYIYPTYPYSKNDIYAAFVERWAGRLVSKGMLGALTNRTGFFLSTFQEWREQVLLGQARMRLLADLGSGILDTALVETAAYCLEKAANHESEVFISVLGEVDDQKDQALLEAVTSLDKAVLLDIDRFYCLPSTPFAYWVPPVIFQLFSEFPRLQSSWGELVRGPEPFDLEESMRIWIEVAPQHIGVTKRWCHYAKGGQFKRFAGDIHLVIDYGLVRDGLKKFRRPGDNAFYFRPGITYTQRTSRAFSTRALPKGCLTSPKGPAIVAYDDSDLYDLLSITNSQCFGKLVELRVGAVEGAARSYDLGILRDTPIPKHEDVRSISLSRLAKNAAQLVQELDIWDETSPYFVRPSLLQALRYAQTLSEANNSVQTQIESTLSQLSSIMEKIDGFVWSLYGISEDDRTSLTYRGQKAQINTRVSKDSQEFNNRVRECLQWIIGVLSGRWDVRIACNQTIEPNTPDIFDYLPVCSGGMLINPDSLPAKPGHIVSKAWLRARPDAITLPPEGSFHGPATIPDSEYPIQVAWDGILVDDPGLGEHPESHPSDVVRRVRQVLALLWPENHAAIEAEACEILSVRELRDYFRKPSGFFADHLKRYSKSRRKAPIYWPLSTPSGSYTLWLYYHRLDDQLLYTGVNRYVTPKIAQVEAHVARLEAGLSQAIGRATTTLRDQLDETRALLAELREFRAELLRIAGLPYKPDLNDGVIINAAPLHKLFRLRKWAKDTKAVWHKLEAGDYDWAHLAYTLWPDRVREVCKRDRSIAIAHGLEELCEAPEKGAKKRGKGRKKKPAAQEELLSYDSKMEEMANVKRKAQP